MPRRDRNPARPNGPQDPKMMSKHCKEQSSVDRNKTLRTQSKVRTWEGGPRKKKKKGYPPRGPRNCPKKTCSRKLMAKHATAQRNHVKPRHTGAQQSRREKQTSGKGADMENPSTEACKESTVKTQKEPHIKASNQGTPPNRRRRTGNGLEPKNKVAESGGEEECEKLASKGRRQLPTQQAPQGAVRTPTPKRPTSDNKRPKPVNTENWQQKHAVQSKERVWNKVEPKTLQRKGRADTQEPTGHSEGRAKSGHTRLQRKQSQRGRELLPTHDRMSAGSTRCRNPHPSKTARNAQ